MLYDPKKWDAPEVEPVEDWRRVLRRAAALLETNGWCQGEMEGDGGRHCALGAIEASYIDPEDGTLAIMALKKVLGAKGRKAFIADWNDTRGRTKKDVIAKLRKAAAS